MRSYYRLLIGIGISKALGLIRFRVLIAYYGFESFTAEVIYVNSIIWFVYGYMILPLINRRFIKELAETSDPVGHLTNKISVLTSFIDPRNWSGRLITFLLALLIFLDELQWVLLLLSLLLMSINEILSLYNLWKGYSLLYNLNTGIWNAALIGVLYYFNVTEASVNIYLLSFILVLVSTIVIHFFCIRNRGLVIKHLRTQKFKRNINLKIDWVYVISTALISSLLAMNIWLVKLKGDAILVSYSVLTKIPELIYSIIVAVIFTSLFTRYSSGKITGKNALRNYIILIGLVAMGSVLALFSGLGHYYAVLLNLRSVDLIGIVGWLIVFTAYSMCYFLFRIVSIEKGRKSLLYLALVLCVGKANILFFVDLDNVKMLFVESVVLIVLSLYLLKEFYENLTITE